jgi:flagellin-like hook-associated protein FlgL
VAAVSLNSNLAALRAKRALNASSEELSATLERLSSGKRINQAADDAAGLAVSSTLNATARVHSQAARNVNEGISFLNVADGATSALKDILFRLRELSTQSSNGTFSNDQRQSLDKESQALQAEYGRILESTSYNGIRVFASGDMVAQAGVGVDAALLVNISSAVSVSNGTSNGTNNADGTFQAKQTFGVGSQAISIAVADFNGDGKSDLVTADYGANTASVLLGNGNGTFQAKQSLGTGTCPASVAVADFNGDSKSDLVVTNQFDHTAGILLGRGDGTFQAQQSFAAGNQPLSVAVTDFNGDGKSDLVTADFNNNTGSVLLGNGNGTFQAKQSFASGINPRSVAVADFNGDGKSDVGIALWWDGTVRILLGNGNGTLGVQQPFTAAPNTSDETWIAVSDLNGDGKNDLVATHLGSNAASVLLGNGNGTFQAYRPFGTGNGPTSVLLTDLNGDGAKDLVTTDSSVNTASVLLGNGNGTFQAKQSFGVGTNPWSVGFADFNSDGVKDLVTADRNSSTVSVLLGNSTTGSGTITTSATSSLQPITGVSLATQQDALLAQGQIDSYLDTVNRVSGTIGTALSRFQIAAHVASSVADVSQAAEARITDADTADNSAALVRNQILQNAASAVLAQANLQPALALTLLRE